MAWGAYALRGGKRDCNKTGDASELRHARCGAHRHRVSISKRLIMQRLATLAWHSATRWSRASAQRSRYRLLAITSGRREDASTRSDLWRRGLRRRSRGSGFARWSSRPPDEPLSFSSSSPHQTTFERRICDHCGWVRWTLVGEPSHPRARASTRTGDFAPDAPLFRFVLVFFPLIFLKIFVFFLSIIL